MIDRAYLLGTTTVVVGLSALTQVVPGKYVMGWQFRAQGASIAIASLGASAANGFSTGYYLGASEIVTLNGPVTFLLAAAGATANINMITYLSAGFSGFP